MLKIKPELKTLKLTDPIHFLALGFGSGLAPKAPGTFGTLAAIPVVLLMAWLDNIWAYSAITVIACVVGVYICQYTADALKTHDHPAIVWDEVAGLMITFWFVPITATTLILGFALFRFFDIIKFWPASYFDKKVHHGSGTILDDVISGIYAGVCYLLIQQLFFAS